MSEYQCPSCGGVCKKSGCERTSTDYFKPSATLQYVHGLAAGDLPMVGDLAMLVARLARKLRKATPADELPAQALDYLNRNGLGCDIRPRSKGTGAPMGAFNRELQFVRGIQ